MNSPRDPAPPRGPLTSVGPKIYRAVEAVELKCPPMARPDHRIVATAVLVALAYYVGAHVGFILRFPPATPSVLWPPNAILTAALLLAPPRRWWIYLLAALPAHLVVELRAEWPTPLVLALFATNCGEALVAAVFVRRFSDAPARLDTLRRVVPFIVGAVLLAPFVSSFPDAAAVAAFKGETFWHVWGARFLSNVLTELTLVPAILAAATTRPIWGRDASRRQHLEAALLAAAILTVAIAAFAGNAGSVGGLTGSPGTPLAFLLPLLLWAAVRFGTRGASLSLLATTLVAIWAGTHGRGPFTALPLAETVHAVQIVLSLVAIPIVCLAALIEERGAVSAAVRERLRFEEFLSRLSGGFVHLPSHEMDEAIETWLGRVGTFAGLEASTLFRLAGGGEQLVAAYSWVAPGLQPGPRVLRRDEVPWLFAHLVNAHTVVFSDPAELAARAANDVDSLRRYRIKSALMIPLLGGVRSLNGIALFTMDAGRPWPPDLVQSLHLVAEVFGNVLARKEAEDALRSSEIIKSAILGSLSSNVAVLDREGWIIAVNESWTRFEVENGGTGKTVAGVGANYLDISRQAARGGVPHACESLNGIEAVLDGSRGGFSFEYPFAPPYPERWFAMSVVPLNRAEGGAVVSHTEITERKRAELEAQRSRQELAHFTRIATMGELTASIAHELSQPLTGILTNAQAGRRFLDAARPDMTELRSILSDIVEDDKRAAAVLHRLRSLLRKGEVQRIPLDLNELIRDVVRLLSSDALIRNLTITLDLDPNPVIVKGDRIELGQVALNLVVNAMDAMTEVSDGERVIVVRTENTGVDAIHVAVQDAGTGIRADAREMVFEPFYTTKPAGMGMGLSIARSIVEAHGGIIWVGHNAVRGTTFHFSLPADGTPSA